MLSIGSLITFNVLKSLLLLLFCAKILAERLCYCSVFWSRKKLQKKLSTTPLCWSSTGVYGVFKIYFNFLFCIVRSALQIYVHTLVVCLFCFVFFADQISWFVDENMDLALSYGEDMYDFVTQYKHLFMHSLPNALNIVAWFKNYTS